MSYIASLLFMIYLKSKIVLQHLDPSRACRLKQRTASFTNISPTHSINKRAASVANFLSATASTLLSVPRLGRFTSHTAHTPLHTPLLPRQTTSSATPLPLVVLYSPIFPRCAPSPLAGPRQEALLFSAVEQRTISLSTLTSSLRYLESLVFLH